MRIEVALCFEILPEPSRLIHTQRNSLSIRTRDRYGSKLVCFHNTKPNASIGLNLPLEILGELLIALSRNDSKRVHIKAMKTITILIDTQAQAATNGLSALSFSLDITQSANLEYIGVVP